MAIEREVRADIPRSPVDFEMIHSGISTCAPQEFDFRLPLHEGEIALTDFEYRNAAVFGRMILPQIKRVPMTKFIDLTETAQRVFHHFGALRTSVVQSDLQAKPGDEIMIDRLKLQLLPITNMLEQGVAANWLTVTLDHFVRSQAMLDKGGWLNRETIKDFVNFGIQVLAFLAPYIPNGQTINICAFNEPSTLALMHLQGLSATDNIKYQKRKTPPAIPTVFDSVKAMKNMAKAIEKLREAAKTMGFEDKFSLNISHHVTPLMRKHKTGIISLIENKIIWLNSQLLNGQEMKIFEKVIQAIAINFYHAEEKEMRVWPIIEPRDIDEDFGPDGKGVEGRGGILLGHSDHGTPGMDYGWRLRPQLITGVLKRHAVAYPDKKLFISETGCPGNVLNQMRFIVGIFRGVQDFNDWAKANGYEKSQVDLIQFWTYGPTSDWGNPPARFNLYHADGSPRLSGRLLEALQNPQPDKQAIETILWAGFEDNLKAIDTLLDQIHPGWRFNRDRLLTESVPNLMVTPITKNLVKPLLAKDITPEVAQSQSQVIIREATEDPSLWEELAIALGLKDFPSLPLLPEQNLDTMRLLFLTVINGLDKIKAELILDKIFKDSGEKYKDFSQLPRLPKWVREKYFSAPGLKNLV